MVRAYCGPGPPITVAAEYEYLEAGMEAGYRPDEFDALPVRWQAVVVARSRVRRRIDAMVAYWQAEEARRKSRR